MWWGTLWLSAVLVTITSAQIKYIPTVIKHESLRVGLPVDQRTTNIFSPVDVASTTDTVPDSPTTEGPGEKPSTTESSCESDDTCSEPNETSPPTNAIPSVEDIDVVTTTPGATATPQSPGGGNSRSSEERESTSKDNDEIDGKDLIVNTKSGQIQGFLWQNNENIISYIDIPYGAFERPFQAATPAAHWGEKIHAVKDHDKRCPQLDDNEYVGDTECLTLSIFKPLEAAGASVLFHIHAEDFNTGSGNPSIYGPDYLVTNGIILVLPNYRLGPLGFLCMQNETAPGNMALKDLSLALSWIKDNIEAFGGNPDNIAVSGDGKSGALAGFIALSPMSKGYVNKVIAESGSFLSYWALDRDPTATATEFFDSIQETENAQSTTEMSFGQFSVKTIVEAAKGIEFKPCIETVKDDAFLSEAPYVTITNQNFENMIFLLGSAMYAGVHEVLLQTVDSIKKLNDDFTLLLPNDLIFRTATLRNVAGGKVKAQYFGDGDISIDDKKNLSLCFTDIGYLGPGIRSARLLVEANATVYFYEFAYVGQMNRVLESLGRPVQGAVRGDIVGYLFTQDSVMPSRENEDGKMVESLTKMWTSFLKNGSPSTDSIVWNKLVGTDHDKEEWLLIDSQPEMKQGLHEDRLSLWTEIYEKHFIDNVGHELSPSVYTVLVFQIIFWFGFCRNAPHIY